MAEVREVAPSAGETGVQSLRRAMDILSAVARSRNGIGLADLCKQVGLHSSTTFHLAKTLVIINLLRQDGETKRYHIGASIFALASGALNEIELLDTARPYLENLADETAESSHIAVWAGDEVVILGKHDAQGSIRLAERVGTARPAYATAIGKVLLSGLPPARLDRYLSVVELAPMTSKTIRDTDILRRAITEVREKGIAYDDGEFDTEVRCLASPVFDFRRRMIAAIGITAPTFRLSLARLSEVAPAIKQAAHELSARFGQVPSQS